MTMSCIRGLTTEHVHKQQLYIHSDILGLQLVAEMFWGPN
jgi:hypothetical protein